MTHRAEERNPMDAALGELRRGMQRGALVCAVAWLAVMALAVGTVTAVGVGSGGRPTSGRRGAAATGPSTPTGPAPAPVLRAAGTTSDDHEPTRGGVAHAVSGPMKNPDLGDVGVAVLDARSDSLLYGRRADKAVLPASVTKLTTATAILRARGPGHRFATRVVAGPRSGDVTIVGGGDPTLVSGPHGIYPGAARLDRLAASTAKALHGHKPKRILVDSSRFDGRTVGPDWDADIMPRGIAAPITALMVDSGLVHPGEAATRYDHPDLAAGRKFARMLGVSAKKVHRGHAGPHARQLAAVYSPPLSAITHIMLQHSDNTIAETLAHQVAVAHGEPGTFANGAKAVTAELRKLGLHTSGRLHLADGSGLSRADRIAPRLLADLLALVSDGHHPRLWPVFTGLPVAGYSGTLWFRYRDDDSERAVTGLLRAKTGSLSGVSTLAGLVLDSDGRLLVFALMAEHIGSNFNADAAMDRVATAVAHCGCRTNPS